MSPQAAPLRVLFVCVENANRSQMAEAFARHHGGDFVEAWSAGSRPSGTINPIAVASMRERGIDLSTHQSKSLSDVPPIEWDWVITMGCGDACPFVKARHREDWALPDPRSLPPSEFAGVRDTIESQVLALLETMKKEIETHG